MEPFHIRQSKYDWAKRNSDKVRQATRQWRELNADKVRRQARERMRRYRNRLKKDSAG